MKVARRFESGGVTKVKGRISNAAVEIVRAVKPYKGGNDALWLFARGKKT
jgi:hypothetical protein